MVTLTVRLGDYQWNESVGFNIVGDGITSSIRMSLQVSLADFVAPATWVHSEVFITLQQSGTTRRFSGVVTDVTVIKQHLWCYELALCSFLERLTYASQKRVFVNESIVDVIGKILKPFPIKSYLQSHFDPISMLVQYHESDKQFLWRLLSSQKLYLRQSENNREFALYDNLNKLCDQPIGMTLMPQTGLYTDIPHIFQWERHDALHGKSWVGKSNALTLKPGIIVVVEGVQYRVITVEHYYKNDYYYNQIFCLSLEDQPKYEITEHIFNGVIPCRITGAGEALNLDSQGQYQIHFPFDNREVSWDRRSQPVAALQMTAGDDASIHFPYISGTQVGVMALEGKLEAPIIVGAMGFSEQPLPVTSENPLQVCLVDRGHYSLLMDDGLSGELAFSNHENTQKISLQKKQNDYQIEVNNKMGDIRLTNNHDMVVKTEQSIVEQAGSHYQEKVEQAYEVTMDNAVIKSNDFTLTAETIALKSEGDMTIQSQGECQLLGKDKLSILTHRGNVTLQAKEGAFTLKGERHIKLKSGSSLRLQNAKGSIVFEENAIFLNGENITFDGDVISLQGKSYFI